MWFVTSPERACALALLGALTLPNPVAAQEGVETAVLAPGQTLRALAQARLGDADLWVEILRFNDLNSVAELTPGLELRLPVGMVSRVDAALAAALARIRAANAEGASLFAAAEIERAIARREEAVLARSRQDWAEAERLATAATETASQAVDRALLERRSGAEAVVLKILPSRL